MADLMSGHPLVGSPGKGNLEAIFERLSQPMLAQPADPKAFRGAADYLQSSARGGARLDDLMGSLIGEKGERVKPDLKAREAMHERVKEAQADTESLLESGGDLGHYLPGHAAHLGATIARGMDYLQSLNPRSTQKAPLDEPMKPDVLAQAKYDRALDLANQPMIALTRVKDGTLIPLDQTVQTLYPALYRSMSQKMVERVITAKAKKEFIPYKQKQAMSLFLGPPLDFTLTQAASQAIIRSSAGQQAQKQAQAQKASGPELEQVNKTAELYALPTERREMDRKS